MYNTDKYVAQLQVLCYNWSNSQHSQEAVWGILRHNGFNEWNTATVAKAKTKEVWNSAAVSAFLCFVIIDHFCKELLMNYFLELLTVT